jgi:archaellum biogenesis ATPase FlaH
MRKSLPFLKSEYLSESHEKKLFEEIKQFVLKYNSLPPVAAIEISLKESTKISETELARALGVLDEISKDKTEQKLEWVLDTTEKFCQERAIYNAIMDSIQIIDGKDANRGKGSIPAILSDALGVSFDPHVGHDYIDSFADRYDFYHRIEKRIPFDLEYFNKITKGGLPQKTLNIALAGTGVGKSLFMCHVAASCLIQNYNVLYITLEMSEEKIAERIDANLMNVTMDDLMNMPKEMYEKRMGKFKDKVKGKLIIKEYPTASANPAHFRALINELSLKKNFKPDIIFIDYLNICASARIKAGANVNSYTYIKAIAEELRGLAVENNVPIVSATQTTRSGFSNSDPGLEDTSESFGLPATADFMFALVSNEELQNLGQMLVKQLKNRYNDPNFYKRFTIGVDRSKMKLYDLEEKAQNNIAQETESKPVFDRGRSTDKFKGLKV